MVQSGNASAGAGAHFKSGPGKLKGTMFVGPNPMEAIWAFCIWLEEDPGWPRDSGAIGLALEQFRKEQGWPEIRSDWPSRIKNVGDWRADPAGDWRGKKETKAPE